MGTWPSCLERFSPPFSVPVLDSSTAQEAYGQDHREGEAEHEHRERYRGVDVALKLREDRQWNGLGDPPEVSREDDSRPELHERRLLYGPLHPGEARGRLPHVERGCHEDLCHHNGYRGEAQGDPEGTQVPSDEPQSAEGQEQGYARRRRRQDYR